MLPAIIHLKSLKRDINENGPVVLILTPYQPPKEDIYTATKAYLDAAELKCFCLFETDEKKDQLERLKSSNFRNISEEKILNILNVFFF